MKREDRDLMEQALSAWRPRDRDGAVRGHPAWHDLDPDARRAVYDETMRLRAIEAALDPDGLSSTAQAVLARIRGR
jgi:hypothetical protein